MYKRSGKKQMKDCELRTCLYSEHVCIYCLDPIEKGEKYYWSDIFTAHKWCAETEV